MAISSKPKGKQVDVDALINKGGSVPVKEAEQDTSTLIRLQLRLAPEMLTRIDNARNRWGAKPSRHFWILEAIAEKLKREEKNLK